MSITVDITISDELETVEGLISGTEHLAGDVPELGLLQTWAEAAYLDDVTAIASMLITTSDDMRELNKQYRDKDKATNVLSFPMESPEEVDICLLGDIVLCAKVIKQEAALQSKSEKSHWAHMVVHSMLHLQGFDHVNSDDAEKMEQLEVNILHQLGFDNPY
ncbi:MAG: rRNA maturation RNase YbeY [Gammaproteobacteria bacterium]|nr:MAG: rRNA maturation RNase YbeY [Gammaproteobacteria bacterium]